MIVIRDLFGLLRVLAAAVVVVVVEEDEVVVEVGIMVKHFVVHLGSQTGITFTGHHIYRACMVSTSTEERESKFMHVCVWHMLSLTPKISF